MVLLAGCGSPAAPPAAPRIANALGAALAAADHVLAPWRCAAADTPALPDETVTIGSHGWRIGGHAVRLDSGASVIGVIADAGGAAPQTIAALGRLRTQLDAALPDLVIALGGMGATQAELEATLGTLADRAPWPVVALPGDLEAETAQVAAIAALRTRGDVVIDGRLARWIELPGATIGTLPGAGAASRSVAGDDGCVWRAEDVAALYIELSTRPGVRIAATSEAPRETFEGEATGELALVPSQPIDVVVHGPSHANPSPARTGARDGGRIALSPGSVDATTRVPAGGPPSAGVLAIHDGSWSWKPLVDAR